MNNAGEITAEALEREAEIHQKSADRLRVLRQEDQAKREEEVAAGYRRQAQLVRELGDRSAK